MVYENYEEINL